MGSVTTEDLRAKSIDELMKIILDLRKEQFNTRFQKSQGEMGGTSQIRVARRAIARAKTILNEKRAVEAKSSTKKAA